MFKIQAKNKETQVVIFGKSKKNQHEKCKSTHTKNIVPKSES